MKKLVSGLIVFCFLLLTGTGIVEAIPQDTVNVSADELSIQDSVSIDDMDPVFYIPEEEEEKADTKEPGKASWTIYVIIGVVVVGGGIVFYQRSKKK